MESVIYKSEVPFDLDAVKDKAQSAGYQAHYKYVSELTFLDIIVASLPYPKMWQWVEASEATFRLLTEINPERMAQHPSGSVYTIHFTPSIALELTQFLKLFLLKYGGWVGVEDEMEVVYNAKNIEALADHPYFCS